MNTANRVIFNTAVSYAVLLFKMAVGIFSVRFVLIALGETNYGVYLAVAGLVALLDMLNGSMISSSMRYMAHVLGSGDKIKIQDTFNTSIYVHYIVGGITVILMEVLGWILLEYVLNIPPELMSDARIIFQMMVLSTFITVIAVPYDAVMNAHEHIYMLSLFDALGALLLLIMAVFLMYSKGDRLIIYGAYQLAILVLLRLLKVYYSKLHFDECRSVRFSKRNKTLVKEIFSFTGWTVFGNLAAALGTHIRGIIMNVFFGVRLNAAEGISRQVNGYISMVAVSMTKAINPQMNKSEGSGDRQRMLRVMILAAKYSAFLFALVGIPVLLETDYIFNLWLDKVPDYAIVFCKISIVSMLVAKFTGQIGHAIYAVGDIKLYQVLESVIAFIPLLLTFVAFSMGFSPVSSYWIGLCCNFMFFAERYWLGNKKMGLNIWVYTKEAVFSVLFPVLMAAGCAYLVVLLLPSSFYRLILTTLVFCSIFTIVFFVFYTDKSEKNLWYGIFKNIISKIKNKI